jgi:hypothetical protein
LIAALIVIIIAFVALLIAITDARNNSQQLKMLIDERNRKPLLSVVFRKVGSKEASCVGSERYSGSTVTLGLANASEAKKPASNVYVRIEFPSVVATQPEMRKKQARATLAALGEDVEAMESAGPMSSSPIFHSIAKASALARSITLELGSLITVSEVGAAETLDGYRAVSYNGDRDSLLLAGLTRTISEEMILWVPDGAPPVRWQITCREHEEWQSGELPFPTQTGRLEALM